MGEGMRGVELAVRTARFMLFAAACTWWRRSTLVPAGAAAIDGRGLRLAVLAPLVILATRRQPC